ncbi:MAG: hypothetical protein JW846_02525 [Dehalococcoidia bacterium]|nr:hypothetical protein [Dehalococcoidia bacterium]
MAESSTEPKKEQEKKGQRGSQKKAVAVVVLLCVAVVATVVALNGGGLIVHSDVADAPAVAEEEELPAIPNRAPQILSVTAASDRIAPFDLCVVECEAIDEDGDTLTYTWSSPQGEIYGEGASIEWGSPNSEGLYRLGVVVDDGNGGSTDYSVSLRVQSNMVPEISSMTADAAWVVPGEGLYISCVAEDGDGDDITYEWEATAGEFFGQGAGVIWVAPAEADSYWVTVIASDKYGGDSKRAIPISVTPAEPPKLAELDLDGKDTDMFKRKGDAWAIFKGRSCTIECVVDEGDGPFTYEWSVDQGVLTADGSSAVWESPLSRISATIVVTVTDRHGNKASTSALIYVETCTCSFG